MLRHFLASAARTTSRSLFAAQSSKPSVSMLSQRARSGGPFEPGNGAWYGSAAVAAIFLGTPFAFAYCSSSKVEKNRPCLTSYDPLPKIAKQGAESDKKDDSFVIGKVSFYMEPTSYEDNYFLVKALINFELPDPFPYYKICDELKLRGIYVDHSENGVRFGLTQYALKYMQKGVEEHLQKKCDCCKWRDCCCEKDNRGTVKLNLSPDAKDAASDQSKKPRSKNIFLTTEDLIEEFFNGEASFDVVPIKFREHSTGTMSVQLVSTIRLEIRRGLIQEHYAEICDGLKQRGIHVERSEEGVRRGLTQLALQYMQKGVEEQAQKKCRCVDQTPPFPRFRPVDRT